MKDIVGAAGILLFVSNEQKSSLWHNEEGRSYRKADDLPCGD